MQSQPVTALLAYCRAGFEKECAAELQHLAGVFHINGYARAKENTAYVVFECFSEADVDSLYQRIDFRQLVFSRQLVRVFASFAQLPVEDRIAPLMELTAPLPLCSDVRLEMPDTNDGKALSTFCRKFLVPFRRALERAGKLRKQARANLHLFFTDGQTGWIGCSDPENSSPYHCGIPRLRFPKDAPSRSTLKLEEAICVLMTEEERQQQLKPRMLGVDLGACPGGWTYQLVRRGLTVAAVDNGPINSELMASGLVEHCQEDGFKFRPARKVDWLVCDMVEKPRMVTELIANWFSREWCHYAIFNLKLPMKKRFVEVTECLQRLEVAMRTAGFDYQLRAKQLYHDREEITVYLARLDEPL